MGKLKSLAGETILYGVGSMLPRFLNFLLVRLHTDVFAPEEYGLISKILAYVAVFNVIYTFGMETAYFRFSTKEGASESRVFNLAQTVILSVSLLISIGLFLTAKPIAAILEIPGQEIIIIWFAAIMFIDAVVAIPFARLRLQKKPLLFALGKIVNIVLLIGLNIYFLKFAYNPAVGIGYVVLANLIANAFFLLFFFKTLVAWRPAFDKNISPIMLQYAYPIMITGLAGVTSDMFSRQTLDWWLPENFYPGQSPQYALGLFSACFKLAVLMSLAIQAFRYAAEPFFFSNASDKQSPALFSKVNHYFIIVCCILLLGVGINLDLLSFLFLGDSKYAQALPIVPILLLGYLFNGVYYNLTVWFKVTDRTYFATIITITGAVITIAANYVLIPIAGYMGSSWATLLCYFSMATMCYLFGQKYYPIPYKVVKGLAYIVITTALVYGINSIVIADQIVATGFHFLVLGLYLFVVYLIEKKELRSLTN
ncbi:MAG TPA: polysaccharide biosynthesis C-terminal domain-containing protein [Chryseolinea sp.]